MNVSNKTTGAFNGGLFHFILALALTGTFLWPSSWGAEQGPGSRRGHITVLNWLSYRAE